MTIDKTLLAKLARLSRLRLDDDEIGRLQHDLAEIVSYVERLQQVDVDGIFPMSHPGHMALLRRSDVAVPTDGRSFLQGSHGYEDGLLRVPKINE